MRRSFHNQFENLVNLNFHLLIGYKLGYPCKVLILLGSNARLKPGVYVPTQLFVGDRDGQRQLPGKNGRCPSQLFT